MYMTEDLQESELFSASCQLVCEWAGKLLSRAFSSLRELSEYLVGNLYVNSKSTAAFTVLAAMQEAGLHNSRVPVSPLFTCSSGGDKHRETQLQLQRKLQERELLKEQKKKLQQQRSRTGSGVQQQYIEPIRPMVTLASVVTSAQSSDGRSVLLTGSGSGNLTMLLSANVQGENQEIARLSQAGGSMLSPEFSATASGPPSSTGSQVVSSTSDLRPGNRSAGDKMEQHSGQFMVPLVSAEDVKPSVRLIAITASQPIQSTTVITIIIIIHIVDAIIIRKASAPDAAPPPQPASNSGLSESGFEDELQSTLDILRNIDGQYFNQDMEGESDGAMMLMQSVFSELSQEPDMQSAEEEGEEEGAGEACGAGDKRYRKEPPTFGYLDPSAMMSEYLHNYRNFLQDMRLGMRRGKNYEHVIMDGRRFAECPTYSHPMFRTQPRDLQIEFSRMMYTVTSTRMREIWAEKPTQAVAPQTACQAGRNQTEKLNTDQSGFLRSGLCQTASSSTLTEERDDEDHIDDILAMAGSSDVTDHYDDGVGHACYAGMSNLSAPSLSSETISVSVEPAADCRYSLSGLPDSCGHTQKPSFQCHQTDPGDPFYGPGRGCSDSLEALGKPCDDEDDDIASMIDNARLEMQMEEEEEEEANQRLQMLLYQQQQKTDFTQHQEQETEGPQTDSQPAPPEELNVEGHTSNGCRAQGDEKNVPVEKDDSQNVHSELLKHYQHYDSEAGEQPEETSESNFESERQIRFVLRRSTVNHHLSQDLQQSPVTAADSILSRPSYSWQRPARRLESSQSFSFDSGNILKHNTGKIRILGSKAYSEAYASAGKPEQKDGAVSKAGSTDQQMRDPVEAGSGKTGGDLDSNLDNPPCWHRHQRQRDSADLMADNSAFAMTHVTPSSSPWATSTREGQDVPAGSGGGKLFQAPTPADWMQESSSAENGPVVETDVSTGWKLARRRHYGETVGPHEIIQRSGLYISPADVMETGFCVTNECPSVQCTAAEWTFAEHTRLQSFMGGGGGSTNDSSEREDAKLPPNLRLKFGYDQVYSRGHTIDENAEEFGSVEGACSARYNNFSLPSADPAVSLASSTGPSFQIYGPSSYCQSADDCFDPSSRSCDDTRPFDPGTANYKAKNVPVNQAAKHRAGAEAESGRGSRLFSEVARSGVGSGEKSTRTEGDPMSSIRSDSNAPYPIRTDYLCNQHLIPEQFRKLIVPDIEKMMQLGRDIGLENSMDSHTASTCGFHITAEELFANYEAAVMGSRKVTAARVQNVRADIPPDEFKPEVAAASKDVQGGASRTSGTPTSAFASSAAATTNTKSAAVVGVRNQTQGSKIPVQASRLGLDTKGQTAGAQGRSGDARTGTQQQQHHNITPSNAQASKGREQIMAAAAYYANTRLNDVMTYASINIPGLPRIPILSPQAAAQNAFMLKTNSMRPCLQPNLSVPPPGFIPLMPVPTGPTFHHGPGGYPMGPYFSPGVFHTPNFIAMTPHPSPATFMQQTKVNICANVNINSSVSATFNVSSGAGGGNSRNDIHNPIFALNNMRGTSGANTATTTTTSSVTSGVSSDPNRKFGEQRQFPKTSVSGGWVQPGVLKATAALAKAQGAVQKLGGGAAGIDNGQRNHGSQSCRTEGDSASVTLRHVGHAEDGRGGSGGGGRGHHDKSRGAGAGGQSDVTTVRPRGSNTDNLIRVFPPRM
nr:hypothetical protein BaRGS_000011 [Batillaria attramentaria]